jgi:DNA repair exonuclease SbcCD ATPase subunit
VKKVIFKKISIKNFLSIGDKSIELDFDSGISLITGINSDKGGRNGVGKSSLVESVYWCLFGSTIRDIKKDKVIHNQTDKNCVVVMEFIIEINNKSKKYKLTRSLEPTKIVLLEDGNDITLSTMPKTDELIKELIGANEEVFQNAVIMTANNTLPFMAQKKIDKRKFVEGILNLGIFGQMLLKTRADYNEYKKENDILGSVFSTQNKNLSLYQSQIEKNKEIKTQKIESLKNKILDNNKKIDLYIDNSSIEIKIQEKRDFIVSKEDSTLKLEDGLLKIENELQKLFKDQLESDFEIKNIKERISEAKKKEGTCPTCKKKYENDDICIDINDLNEKLSTNLDKNEKINKKISTFADKKRTLKSAISSNKFEIEKLNKEIQQLLVDSKEIYHLKDKNDELLKDIEEIKNSKDNVDDLIENVKKEIKESEDKIQKLQKQLLILETAKFVVSEEGVKSYIVKKMLSVLNSQLNFYLKTLNAPCTCEFNELFEETIYNSNGKECSYFNFSGGERKRIDIAILFMFQDILKLQTGVSFNISMYDELFDSALDESGVFNVMDVLKDRVEKTQETIYIISHNKTASSMTFTNTILLEKKNGTTFIVT